MENLSREVVSHFYKDASGRVHLNALTVLQEENPRNTRETYLVRQEWYVDYSRQYGYIFHNSGFGGDESIEVSGIYHVTAKTIAKRLLGEHLDALVAPRIVEKEPSWVDARDEAPFDNKPRTLAVRKRNRTRQLFKLPKAFNLEPGQDLLDWLQNNGIESESVWCSTCRDFFPASNEYDLCEHVWWCEKTGNYSTPDERCKCKDQEDCRK